MSTVTALPINPLQVDAGQGYTIEDFVKTFHDELEGHFHHAYIDPSKPTEQEQWNQTTVSSIEEFGKALSFNFSEYMNFNSSYYKTRKVSFPSKFDGSTVNNVVSLNAFVIDVDLYKSNYTKEQFIDVLHDMVKFGVIPSYRFLVNSGNGFYIIWQIERVTLSRKGKDKEKDQEILDIYKIIQGYFIELFERFGVDKQCKDIHHVYGIPGTYNCKNGKKLRFIQESYDEAVLTMEEIREDYLPTDLEPKTKKKTKSKPARNPKKSKPKAKTMNIKSGQTKKRPTRHKSASSHKRFNTAQKHRLIVADIERLAQLRKHKPMEGYRSLLCFMLRYSWNLLADDELAVEKMLELNNQFLDPIHDDVLIEQTKYAVLGAEDFKAEIPQIEAGRLLPKRNGYNYKKETFVELLEITPEEQEQLEYLVSPAVTYERKKEKQKDSRRDEYDFTKRDQKALDTFSIVQRYKKEDKTQEQVVDLTGISKRTVERNWNRPNSKNSELIYAVYCEFVSAQEVEESPSMSSDSQTVTSRSCYVKKKKPSSLGDKPFLFQPSVSVLADIDDGSLGFLARQAEVLTLDVVHFIRDSVDSDERNFDCLVSYWRTFDLPDGTSCDVAYGETLRIFDSAGNVIWRNPNYFKRKQKASVDVERVGIQF
jgi:hypothetical protein